MKKFQFIVKIISRRLSLNSDKYRLFVDNIAINLTYTADASDVCPAIES